MNQHVAPPAAPPTPFTETEVLTQLQFLRDVSRKTDQTTDTILGNTKVLLPLIALLDRPDRESLELADRLAVALATISETQARIETSVTALATQARLMQEDIAARLDALEQRLTGQSELLGLFFDMEDGATS